jgi:peptidoglycan/xylan/chitin deacetylase (PgdA/CDA1 family)
MQETGLLEICSHTLTHPIVSRLDDDELSLELVASKTQLEATFGQKVRAFGYPNGETSDFDARTRRAVTDAGYDMAFTSIEGVNYGSRMDWLALRRVHAHPRTAVFAKLASGLGNVQRLFHAPRMVTACPDKGIGGNA